MVVNEELLNTIRQAIVELEGDNEELKNTISVLQEKQKAIDEDLFALEHFLKRYDINNVNTNLGV